MNGVSESVTSGGNFPAANPLFQLVSLSASVARVAVVGGSYANGSPTLTLRVNKPVTLANTADGTRYTLTLQPQGTVAGGSASAASPSGSTDHDDLGRLRVTTAGRRADRARALVAAPLQAVCRL